MKIPCYDKPLKENEHETFSRTKKEVYSLVNKIRKAKTPEEVGEIFYTHPYLDDRIFYSALDLTEKNKESKDSRRISAGIHLLAYMDYFIRNMPQFTESAKKCREIVIKNLEGKALKGKSK